MGINVLKYINIVWSILHGNGDLMKEQYPIQFW